MRPRRRAAATARGPRSQRNARTRIRASRGQHRRPARLERSRACCRGRAAALSRRDRRSEGQAMNEELTYELAVARVEEIIRRLDSGDAGLRETLELVKEGRALVEFCAGELEAVSHGLEELRLDELVARLEAGAAQAPQP